MLPLRVHIDPRLVHSMPLICGSYLSPSHEQHELVSGLFELDLQLQQVSGVYYGMFIGMVIMIMIGNGYIYRMVIGNGCR